MAIILDKTNLHTIPELLQRFGENSEHKAIICEEMVLSNSKFVDAINELSSKLIMHKLPRGYVILMNQNKLQFLIGLYGTINAGYIPVPINTDIPSKDLFNIIREVKPKGIITNIEHFNSYFAPRSELVNSINLILIFNPSKKILTNNERVISFYPSFKNSRHKIVSEISPADNALLLFTSGTDGKKKGVLLTHRNLIETTKYMNNSMGITDGISEFIASPLTHSFGLSRTRSILLQGGTMVLTNGKFNPEKALESIRRYRCNAISGVSSIFSIFIKNYEHECKEIGNNIKWIETGGMSLPVEHTKKLLEVFPNSQIFMNYGLTEAMKSTIIEFRKESNKIGSVGRPSPGIKIKVTDYENRVLGSEKIGIILIQGVNVAKGYFGNNNEWMKKYHDGWFSTGDIGYFDEDGYLRFLGRKDELINVGGKKFHPSEVEPFLDSIFNEAAIICGIPDPKGILGEIPVICVEGKKNNMINEVRSYLKTKVENFKIPRYIFHLEKFPITDNGKIRRKEIQQIISEF